MSSELRFVPSPLLSLLLAPSRMASIQCIIVEKRLPLCQLEPYQRQNLIDSTVALVRNLTRFREIRLRTFRIILFIDRQINRQRWLHYLVGGGDKQAFDERKWEKCHNCCILLVNLFYSENLKFRNKFWQKLHGNFAEEYLFVFKQKAFTRRIHVKNRLGPNYNTAMTL